jgi:hypothetical protein
MRSSPQRRRHSNDCSQRQQQEYTYCHQTNKREMKSSLLTLEDDQHQHNWTMFKNMMDDVEDYQQLSKHNNSNHNQLVDTIVNAATICNTLVTEYCGLCTLYLDRQVQYELISSASVLPSSTFDYEDKECSVGIQGRPKAARDVAEVAMMLFDEESVVASVSSR